LKNQTEQIEAIFERGLKPFRRSDITNAGSQTNRKRLAIIESNNGQFPESFMIRILTGMK